VLGVRRGGVGLAVDRLQPELPHQPLHALAIDPGSIAGGASRALPVVARPRQLQQFALPQHDELGIFALDHAATFLSPQAGQLF